MPKPLSEPLSENDRIVDNNVKKLIENVKVFELREEEEEECTGLEKIEDDYEELQRTIWLANERGAIAPVKLSGQPAGSDETTSS